MSKYDDMLTSRKCFELGLTIKDWSRDKSMRDMHKKIPTFGESEHYHHYLEQLNQIKKENPEQVISMSSTKQRTQILMHGQDRNRHGKMFGGYLMREAFDIAYVTAALINPGGVAELLRVD